MRAHRLDRTLKAAGRSRSNAPKLGTTADNPHLCFVSASFPCFYAARIVQEGDPA